MSQTDPPITRDPWEAESPDTPDTIDFVEPWWIMDPPPELPLPGAADLAGQPDIRNPPGRFWHTRLGRDVVPLATSLFLHLTAIILGIILIPKIVNDLNADHHKDETLVPEVQLARDDDIGGVMHPGLGGDPTRDAAQENEPGQKLSAALSLHGATKFDLADSAGGDSGNLVQRGQGNGPGAGTSGGNDPFGGSGGEAAFGPRGGGGGHGPPSKLVGSGGNVKTVVFVCDGSGSMIGAKMETLKAELIYEIAGDSARQRRGMQPMQCFNIIFFQENEQSKLGYTAFRTKLVPANVGNQLAVVDFLKDKIDPHRGTDPRKALDEAFKESPQLIFFLTDGEFNDASGPDDDEVLAYFRQKNATHQVHVNTVLFLESKAEDADAANVTKTLSTVANENGGIFRLLHADAF